MERKRLEDHHATLKVVKDSLIAGDRVIASAVYDLAVIVNELVEDALAFQALLEQQTSRLASMAPLPPNMKLATPLCGKCLGDVICTRPEGHAGECVHMTTVQ